MELEAVRDMGLDFAVAALPITDTVKQSYSREKDISLFPYKPGYAEQRDTILDKVSALLNEDAVVQETFDGADPMKELKYLMKEKDPNGFSLSIHNDITGLFEQPGFVMTINRHAGNHRMASVRLSTHAPNLLPLLGSLISGKQPNIDYSFSTFLEGGYHIKHAKGKTEITKLNQRSLKDR